MDATSPITSGENPHVTERIKEEFPLLIGRDLKFEIQVRAEETLKKRMRHPLLHLGWVYRWLELWTVHR